MVQKFIPGKVTIRPCGLGYGYFYRNECFAYAWAWRPFSNEWWLNLLLFADKHPQDLLKLGEDLRKIKANRDQRTSSQTTHGHR